MAGASGCLPAAAQRLAVNQGPGPQETVQKSSVNKLAKTTLDRAATISNYGDSQKSHTRTNFCSGGTSRPACVVRTRKKCEVAAQAACRSNSGYGRRHLSRGHSAAACWVSAASPLRSMLLEGSARAEHETNNVVKKTTARAATDPARVSMTCSKGPLAKPYLRNEGAQAMSFAVTLRAPSILSAVCCSTVTGRWKNSLLTTNDARMPRFVSH